ncbi:MAG: bifunctional oligoribonuclease/PAP phosphatase NrnA [Candidatus Aenigmatarchaeota archaeon]
MGSYEELESHIEGIDEPLGVISHENLDPDSIASYLAVKCLFEDENLETEMVTRDKPDRVENKLFLNYLDMEIREMEPSDVVEEYGSIGLVDSNPEGLHKDLKNGFEESGELREKTVFVIDHHPIDEKTEEMKEEDKFIDVRDNVGANATIMNEYIEQSEKGLDTKLATALYYGISSDTDDLSSPDTTTADHEAATHLWEYVDAEKVQEFKGTVYTRENLEVLSTVIDNSEVRDDYLVGYGGLLSDDEIESIPQAADEIIKRVDVNNAMIYAINIDSREVDGSIRDLRPENDAGELASEFGQSYQNSSGGGHTKKAGINVGLGVFGEIIDDEELETVARKAVESKWFDDIVGKKKNGEE